MLKHIHSLKNWFGIALLLALSTGCSKHSLQLPGQMGDADLKIRIIQNALGIYTIAGETNLPEKSKVAIAAVRYLYPADQGSQNLNPKPTYSILAYQATEVNQGKWQTELKLWQVAPDGQFQESWQLDQTKLKLPLKPAKDVVFLATLVPSNEVDQLQSLEQQLAKQNLKIANSLVQTTAEGQQYVQVGQTQTISLPTGRTAAPPLRPEDINGGWGRRYLMPPESQNPYKLEMPFDRRTNAPPSPDEFLR